MAWPVLPNALDIVVDLNAFIIANKNDLECQNTANARKEADTAMEAAAHLIFPVETRSGSP